MWPRLGLPHGTQALVKSFMYQILEFEVFELMTSIRRLCLWSRLYVNAPPNDLLLQVYKLLFKVL
jgi:hypothetical protein